MLSLDLDKEFHARVASHLQHDGIAWLTTVDADGTPQPSPIWFLWDDGTILFYSQPNQGKLRNIARNPRVSLSFNGDRNGGDIVVLNGTATLDPNAPAADRMPAYVEKYHPGLLRIGTTPESFARDYPVAVRIDPDRLRGH